MTTDIKRRLTEHNTSKRGAKSIKGKLPVELVYFEEHSSIGDALKREIEIKGWARSKKLALINNALALMSAAKKRA